VPVLYSAARADVSKMPGLTVWRYKQMVARSVIVGSQADAAGIHAGDEIVSMNGADVYQYYEQLDASCGASKETTVVFRNDSGEHTAVLGAMPSKPAFPQ
jgi:predicted metalloprotease with PDZ domain